MLILTDGVHLPGRFFDGSRKRPPTTRPTQPRCGRGEEQQSDGRGAAGAHDQQHALVVKAHGKHQAGAAGEQRKKTVFKTNN